MSNPNFITLIATTLQNFTNKIIDQVVTNNALFYMMRKAGNMQVVSGGRQFVEQIFYKANSSFAARGKLDTIPLPVTEGHSAATYNIKVVDGSIVLPMVDIAMNAGSREQLINYAKAKAQEAKISWEEVMGTQTWNTSVGSDDLDSIPRLISETPSADTDVGGIDSSTTAGSYWRNYAYTTTVASFNSSQNGLNAIDTSIGASTKGSMGPKLIVTTQAIWTLLQLALTPNQRYTSPFEKGCVGFKALEYAGIPVVADDGCLTGNMYGIDTEHVKLKALAQGNFKETQFQMHHDALLERMLMYFIGNYTMDSRRTNFVINSITG